MTKRYDPNQTWKANLDASPNLSGVIGDIECVPGDWKWCGIPVASPLGISAGPLLNSQWLLHYANLGFDILVYKTVRSVAHPCYDLPNLVPVSVQSLSESGTTVSRSDEMNGTWAVSFGMPSQAPDVWREDIAAARRQLPEGKALVVSVVGTQDSSVADPEESLTQLAQDFAQCAVWAMDAGAHGVEANFSCPNVCTADGQLYQQPESAGIVAATIRQRIGSAPLVLKIGRVTTVADAERLIDAVGPHVNGIAMTNSIAAKVANDNGQLLFDGQQRGICGKATLDASIAQAENFRAVMDRSGCDLDLIGVGGVSTAGDVSRYLNAGANTVAMATSAMLDPLVGAKIRRQLAGEASV